MKPSSQFFIFVLVFFLFQSAHAQFEIGLIGGLNRSGLSGDKPNNSTYTTLTGLGLGALLEMKLTQDVRFGFQPMYLQRGTKIAYKIPDVRDPKDSLNFKINYVTIPFMFKVYADNQKTYLISGFDIGIPLSASIEQLDGSDKQDVLDRLKSVDVAVSIGFGVRIPVNQFNWAIELRYVQGILNLNDATDATVSPLDFSIRSTGFQIFTSLSLPLGKDQ
jgi:hypothetical protein